MDVVLLVVVLAGWSAGDGHVPGQVGAAVGAAVAEVEGVVSVEGHGMILAGTLGAPVVVAVQRLGLSGCVLGLRVGECVGGVPGVCALGLLCV